MNILCVALFSAALIFTLSGCGAETPMPSLPKEPSPTAGAVVRPSKPPPGKSAQLRPTPEGGATDDAMVMSLNIGGKNFSVTLLDNDAARALVERLPLTLELSELHGNEKYYYLDEDLPTASEQPGQIRAGDLMLYGSDCLVLFYDNFSSGYRYTRLGSLDNPEGLAQAVGGGGVTVTFALQ